jgi:hypothetical protein
MKHSTNSIRLLLCMSVAITALSCKKDKDNTTTTKTQTELLTTSVWKYTAAIISPAYDYYGDGQPVTDIFSIMKSCEKDDYEVYNTSGIWEYNEGLTKCDSSYDQVFHEPWHFAENETKLIIGGVECEILQLDATTLKLRYSFEDAGTIYTEEDTYSH